ncbi:MAG: hypothetical protein QNK20_16580 [Aureibaculum sp.]|nr:hypothetical protein [Aureibaculum sp.]
MKILISKVDRAGLKKGKEFVAKSDELADILIKKGFAEEKGAKKVEEKKPAVKKTKKK